jgi:hypothetical protein
LLGLSLTAGFLLGCGTGGIPPVIATLSLDSPSNNSTVNLPVNKQIAINFSTNYTLKTPGTCTGLEHCGHVYVLVDSSSCNLPNLPYNALAVATPVQADLSKCATATGSHTVTLELHYDDDSVVKNVLGTPITSSAMITVQ